MTIQTIKPSVPDVVERFRAYYNRTDGFGGCEWGVLHTVLSDDNLSDGSVRFCIHTAIEERDVEGEALARLLLMMSKTQRAKLGRISG